MELVLVSGYNSGEMSRLIPDCVLYLPYVVIVPALAAWWRCNAIMRHSLLLRGITAIATAILLGVAAGQGYYDVRPFARSHTEPLIRHIANNGFPLWQLLLPATVAFVLWPYWRPAGYFALAVGAAAAAAAIAAGISSPFDALGGLAVAAVAALLARALVRRGEKKRHLYPQRTGSSTPSIDQAPANDKEMLFHTGSADALRPSATISEFEPYEVLGYSNSIRNRN